MSKDDDLFDFFVSKDNGLFDDKGNLTNLGGIVFIFLGIALAIQIHKLRKGLKEDN